MIIVNTGYLGLPMTVALLGVKALPAAVAYDQLISGPTFYIAGFAIGAVFGTRSEDDGVARLRSFVLRNPPLLAMIAGPHAYLLQAAMPSGINSLIIAKAYGLDRQLVATAIIWSTAITIAIGLALAAA